MWRVAADILNKKLQIANRLWSSSLGVGQGLTVAYCKTPACYEMLHRASNFDRFFGIAK
jgi:hypothetical protein